LASASSGLMPAVSSSMTNNWFFLKAPVPAKVFVLSATQGFSFFTQSGIESIREG
jgi:hypothetical protein